MDEGCTTRWVVTVSYADNMRSVKAPRKMHVEDIPEDWYEGNYSEAYHIFGSKEEAVQFCYASASKLPVGFVSPFAY